MNIPYGETLKIVSYRDFYDVPRLVFAGDDDGNYWVLDSPFDDDADEYSENYMIYSAGQNLPESQKAFTNWSARPKLLNAGTVCIREIRFDQTRRATMTIPSRDGVSDVPSVVL